MGRPKRTRQSAQDDAEAAAAAPARRTRRAAAADADDNEQQQLHQPRTTRVTRRSQQQQQDAADAAEQQAGRGTGRQRRQRRTQQHEQEQQSGDEQQQVGQHEQHGTQQGAAGAGGEQLDDFSKDAELIQAVDALGQASADPAAFLQPNIDIAQAARQAAKALLQYTVTSASAARQPDQQQQRQQPDPQQQSQLYVGDGFDSEQVWLQLDMQLAPLRKRLRKLVGQIADSETAGVSELITPEVEADLDAVLGEGQQQSDSEQEPGSSDVDEHDSDMMDGQDGLSDSDHDMAEGDAAGEDDEQQADRKSAKQKKQLLPVEDRFMRLDEMEAFVAQAEREAAGLSDDEDDDEDDAGLSDDDDPGQGLAGSDLGSDDDAGLEDLLTSSAALVGKKLSKQQQQQQKVSRHRGRTAAAAAGSDEEGLSDSEGLSDEDTDQDVDAGEIMYKDFFGDLDGDPSDQPGSDLDQDQSDRSDDDQDQDHDLGSDSQDLDLDGQLGSDDEGVVLGSKARKAAAAAAAAAGGKKRVHWDDGAADGDDDDVSMSDGEQEQEEAPLSTHEKRLLRMQERIAELEDEALGEKPWHLIGEVSATRRPVNSALEIDMDYDTTNKPPPAPTEEATHSLEDMIKRRIAEARWDDVIRVLPPPPETKKKTLEPDDTKAQQGLGEIYESEYVQQATGFTAPDKAEPLRRQAVALFKALCGKLDALSSFAFTPKPVVEELEVRSDVAALAVEEVAPLAVSDAAMRTPGEVYNPQAHGEQKAEAELTQEERKRRRAKKKRAHKNKEAARASAAAARAAASGDSTALAGRKSLATQLAAATSSGLIKKGVAAQGGKSDFGKSSAVFGKIAEQAAAGKEGKKKNSSKGEGKGLNSAMLKL